MESNRLFTYLKHFDKEDLRAFKKYLKALHPRKKIAHRFFNYVINYHPAYDHPEDLETARVFKVAFKRPYKDTKDKKDWKNLLNTSSDLTRWLQDFLVMEELNRYPEIYDWLLLQQLRAKNMEEEEQRIIHNNINQYEKKKDRRTPWDFFWESRLRHMEYYSTYSDKFKERDNLEQLVKATNELFLVSRLKYGIESISRSYIINEEIITVLLDEALAFMKVTPSFNNLSQLYYNLLLFQKESPTDETFLR